MPISFQCHNPGCGKKITAKDEMAGRKAKCPGCGASLQVPHGANASIKAKASAAAAVRQGGAPQAASRPAPAPAVSNGLEPTAVEETWRRSPLFRQRSEFLVKRKILSLWTLQLYFQDPSQPKETLGWAKYKRGFFRVIMESIKLSFLLPLWCEITDEAGNTLFWLREKWQWFSFYTKIDVYDPERKHRIAYFKIKLFSLLGGLWVYDNNHQHIGEVAPNFGLLGVKVKGELPMFTFTTKDGRRLGFITSDHEFKYVKAGKKPGVHASVTVGEMGYSCALTPEVSNQSQLKVLLLAATLIMKVWGVGAKIFDPIQK